MRCALICFPFAGAGASFYRPWSRRLGSAFQILPVQLPGREDRLGEDLYSSVEAAIDEIEPEVMEIVGATSKIALFGHSFGAALAYELARRLDRRRGLNRCHLVVSGSPSPTRPRQRRATGLSDTQFLDQVRTFAGYSHPALENPEMRDVVLPALRSDVQMHENYVVENVQPLSIGITCLRGRTDELVCRADAAAWQELTKHPMDLIEVEGGHMYLSDAPEELFEILSNVCLAA